MLGKIISIIGTLGIVMAMYVAFNQIFCGHNVC